MANLRTNTVYIGVGGHVVALDVTTGDERWRTRLKRSGLVTVCLQGDALYGAAGGELFRLDPDTGAVRWKNRLRGLGLNVVTFSNSAAGALAAAIASAHAAAG